MAVLQVNTSTLDPVLRVQQTPIQQLLVSTLPVLPVLDQAPQPTTTGSSYCSCESGQFWNETECSPCAEGSATPVGAVQCQQCSLGSVNGTLCTCEVGNMWEWRDRSAGLCQPCPEGTYKTEGVAECLNCPEYSTSSAGSEFCSCQSGMYRNNTRCYHCTGMSASPEGAVNCTKCPLGSISLNNGTSCSCPAGQIWSWDENKTGSCQPCPENTWREESMTTCTACPEFGRSESGSACCTCSGGKYWSNSSCVNCPPGAGILQG